MSAPVSFLDHLETCDCGLCGASDTKLVLVKSHLNIVQCTSCGLLRTNPRLAPKYILDESAQEKVGNGYFSAYERSFLPSRTVNYRQWLAYLQSFRRTNRILDIGTGPGHFLAEATEVGWDALGVEPCQAEVAYARQRGLHVIPCGVEDVLSLQERDFDVVTLWDSFEHLADPVAAASAVHSLLRPGGAVLLRVPDAGILGIQPCLAWWERPLYWLYARYVFAWHPIEHLYHYSRETLSRLLTQCGFQTLGSWPHETMNSKECYSAARWKRPMKRVILMGAVRKGWPHSFVHISVKPDASG